jgi:hypothetical protein
MKEYDTLDLFDNLTPENDGADAPFSLAALMRNAAQRMIQAAVEDEVTEFLPRLPHQTACLERAASPFTT